METGTIIAGTHKAEHLIPAFFKALEEVAPLTAEVRRTDAYAEEIEAGLAGPSGWGRHEKETHPDDVDEFKAQAVGALMSGLEANAPEGTYFGTLEGDGSNFGFWPIDERS